MWTSPHCLRIETKARVNKCMKEEANKVHALLCRALVAVKLYDAPGDIFFWLLVEIIVFPSLSGKSPRETADMREILQD